MVNQASKNKSFLIQKDCICLIFNKPKSTHTDPLFRKSQLLKLSELTELELLKINQKHYKQNLPLAIRVLFGTNAESIKHRYNEKTDIYQIFSNILMICTIKVSYINQ